MAENTPYFEAIVAHYAGRIDQETALRGDATLSFETQGTETELDIVLYIETYFRRFMELVEHLAPRDQAMLLQYYVLGKTQNQMALWHRSAQTQISTAVRMAVRRFAPSCCWGRRLSRPSARSWWPPGWNAF